MESQEPDFARIESLLNPSNGKLPFGYYAPNSGGKITWNCGTDQNNKIISVFKYEEGGQKDKRIAELKSMDEATYSRNELIKNGWLPIKPPEITIKYEDGTEKLATRKQKRKLKKAIGKMGKNNPFDDEV